ncbi:Glyoxylase, beta-lactamase superfamily II [Streptomyces sp. 3213]|uniref:MBL fold metallo-hydrolase n=1 Tax=Streptomyces sp. 3213.3 TaxID=1855348 RepID=UPI00089B2277|nr:MBL fold metallo-hydrolase [Streptomyces sp. 3213.3]SEE51694.1 Glyoxylase, beta-lactamase superfamily II [Streptomyces sp. 3213] [Streptomyces sp. 3213.3]
MTDATQLHEITAGVHMWAPDGVDTWGLANCGLVHSDGEVLLVDTPYTPALTEDLLAATRRVTGGTAPGTVVATHANGDHTWGNQCLVGSEILATDAALEHQCVEPTPQQLHALVWESDPDQPLGWYFRRHFGKFDFSGIQVLPPTATFSGRHDLTVGRIPVELHEVGPAHTVGDLVVHLPEQRVVFAGDIVFSGDHPCHWAGPLDRIAAAAERVLAFDPEWIVPGHGPLMTPGQLRTYIAYLDDLSDQALLLHGQGKTPIEAARILIDEDRYPGLGLPERLAITLSTEFRHLNQDHSRPSLVEPFTLAARIAWRRASDRAASA